MTTLLTGPTTGTHPAGGSGLELLRQIEQLARRLSGAEATGTAGETVTLVAQLTAMLTAYQARVIRESANEEAEQAGAGNTGQWIADHTRHDTREATRQARLAEALASASATEQAMGAGQISDKHAEVITGALVNLPQHVNQSQRQVVEAALVQRARQIDPTRLRREAKRALAAIEPDPAVVDDHEDALLTAEEDAAMANTWLTMFDQPDGTTLGHFQVPTLYAHMLRKVIHAMASPRRHPTRTTGDGGSAARAAAGGSGSGSDGTRAGDGDTPTRQAPASGGGFRGAAAGGEPVPHVDFDHIPTAHHEHRADQGSAATTAAGPDTAVASGHGGSHPAGRPGTPTQPDRDATLPYPDPHGTTTPTGPEGSASDAGSGDGSAGPGSGSPPDASPPVDVWAGLSWKQRYGRAFLDLLRHIPTDHLHPKTAATIVAHLDHAQLREDVARAVGTDTAHRMSAATLRHTACQAGILPAVYNGPSVPINLGRTSRLFTPHQRLLLAQHYPTCAADGCDRPFAWTEIHHLTPWAGSHDRPNGATDLTNALPLCSHHHHLIHHRDYTHTVTTGHPDNPADTVFTDNPTSTSPSSGSGLPTYTVTYRRR